jgi:Zn-dependent peptidase ImmA (M78 family)/transcriptional regulator with XRE-family HTH domain
VERIQTINPERIRWCCDDRGITPEQLAEEAGIAQATMQAALEEGKGLTFQQLRRIAEYFNRGILFFLEEGEVREEQVHTPQFRTITNQKPDLPGTVQALIERVEHQREVYLTLREDLDDEPITFQPPDVPNDSVPAARIARQWLGLNGQKSFDEYRAAVEDKGILVFRSNGYAGKWQISKQSPIAGFAIYNEVCPVIFVRKEDAEARQTFTLMHELGHILLHRRSFIDEQEDLYSYTGHEREASVFAGRVLIPDERLRDVNVQAKPEDVAEYVEWLRPYRKAWGVSGDVILLRLKDIGAVTQADYDEYRRENARREMPRKEGGSRKYRHREPKHVFGETFVRTVLDALYARHITLARASTYLDNLKVRDIHKLKGYYAGL